MFSLKRNPWFRYYFNHCPCNSHFSSHIRFDTYIFIPDPLLNAFDLRKSKVGYVYKIKRLQHLQRWASMATLCFFFKSWNNAKKNASFNYWCIMCICSKRFESWFTSSIFFFKKRHMPNPLLIDSHWKIGQVLHSKKYFVFLIFFLNRLLWLFS